MNLFEVGGNPLEIRQKPLGEVVAEELRKGIWKKEYAFGQRLIETELAEEYEISRSTLREAFRILEVEKLVTTKARKGTFVTEFTQKDIDEINEIRILLEAPALVQASDNLQEQDTLILQSMLKDLKNMINEENWYEAFNTDMKFHFYLVNLCNNQRIIDIYTMLLYQIRTIITISQEYYGERKQLYYERHNEVFQAMKSQDKEWIKNITETHIDFLANVNKDE